VIFKEIICYTIAKELLIFNMDARHTKITSEVVCRHKNCINNFIITIYEKYSLFEKKMNEKCVTKKFISRALKVFKEPFLYRAKLIIIT
jgi:hypothetical protein